MAPTGRPRDVPRDLVESMKEERENEDLGLRGVDLRGLQAFVANRRQDYAVAHGGNPDVAPPPLPRSVAKRLRKEIAPDIGHGVMKTTARVMALNDFHNAVSHAAIAQNLVDIRPELFVNVDDTGLLLGTKKGTKPLLYSAAGIADKLRQRGLQRAMGKVVTKFRVCHIIFIVNAAGVVMHYAILIEDSSFPHSSCHFIGPERTLSVWLLRVNYDKQKLFGKIIRKIVVPKLRAIEAALLAPPPLPLQLTPPSDTESLEELDEAPAAPPASEPLRKVIEFDGAFAQVNAVLQQAELLEKCKEANVELVKFAAACSAPQQPLDNGPCFANLKSYFNSSRFDFSDTTGSPSTFMVDFLHNVFDQLPMTGDSKSTFRCLLSHIEAAVSKSFPMRALQLSFERSGNFPFSCPQIFAGYAGWSKLPGVQQAILIAATPHFARYAGKHGSVPDAIIDAYLAKKGLDFDFFELRDPSKRPLEELHPSYQRDVWLNNDRYLADQQQKAAAKEAEKQRLAQARVDREAKKEARKLAKEEADRRREEKAARKLQQQQKQPVTSRKARRRKQPPAAFVYQCGNPACTAQCVDGGAGEENWKGCETCRGLWFCPARACQLLLEAHERNRHGGGAGRARGQQ